MRALLLLPLQWLILTIRLWLVEHIFTTDTHISWLSISIGGISAAALVFAKPFLTMLGRHELLRQNTATYSNIRPLIAMLVWTIGILLINKGITHLWTKHTTTTSSLWGKELLLWGLLISGSYMLLGYLGVGAIGIYYLLVAGGEEGLKRISSLGLYQRKSGTRSDIILFALLVALGFAFFENIIYMREHTREISTISQQLYQGSGLLIMRGLVGFLVHMLFTGVIAALSLRGLLQGKSYRYILALGGGIMLHMSYNIALYHDRTVIIIFYLLGGYMLLSRLFYQSDSLYLSPHHPSYGKLQ